MVRALTRKPKLACFVYSLKKQSRVEGLGFRVSGLWFRVSALLDSRLNSAWLHRRVIPGICLVREVPHVANPHHREDDRDPGDAEAAWHATGCSNNHFGCCPPLDRIRPGPDWLRASPQADHTLMEACLDSGPHFVL